MAPTLTITPADALIDVPRQIRVEHVAPGATVEITALTRRTAWSGKPRPPTRRARTAWLT